MQIALKNNQFNDNLLNITKTNRNQIAKTLTEKAVEINIQPKTSGQEAIRIIFHHLKQNKNDIVRYETDVVTEYYMYKPVMTRHNMPSMRIIDIDTDKPWIIVTHGGIEFGAYLHDAENNQKTMSIVT